MFAVMKDRPAVVVMVKAPVAGSAKTRLAPALGADAAAQLAARFAQDALACAQREVDDVIIAFAPADGRTILEKLLPAPGLHWLAQRGADLGARLADVAAEAFAQGFGPLLFLGADSPTLPDEHLRRGLDALTNGEADVTLGPTEDGGYYAVGLRHLAPELFRGVAWSTSRAYADTAANAARLNLRLLRLPAWYDVDTPGDLRRLRAELSRDEAARARAPHTWAWLNSRQISQHEQI